MFICNDPKFVFVDIPKTGSSSILKYLEENYKKYGKPTRFHELKIPSAYKDFFSFCVVRNPYDRMCSLWWWTSKKETYPDKDVYHYLREMNKREMENNLYNFCIVVNDRLRRLDISKQLSIRNSYCIPQSVYVKNNNFDKVLHFENLEEEITQLPFIKDPVKLPHKHKTYRPHWTKLVDGQSIAKINKLYSEEFEIFRYEKL